MGGVISCLHGGQNLVRVQGARGSVCVGGVCGPWLRLRWGRICEGARRDGWASGWCLRSLAAFMMAKGLGEMGGVTSCCYRCRDERGKWVDEWVAFLSLGSFDQEGPDRRAGGAGELGFRGW